MNVVIVSTGAANVASVLAALRRLGVEAAVVDSPDAVRGADRVILPGVGAFGPAMAGLKARGLDSALRDRIAADRPTLGICLGLQLLFEGSDESAGVDGLGVLTGRVERFAAGLRVPQMGWNRVRGAAAIPDGDGYFANSFRVAQAPTGCDAAWSEHGGAFVAAVARGRLLACQFHPELSGAWGSGILRSWLEEPGADRSRPALPPTLGPARRVVPCLDVADGRVVKGVRFQGLRDAGDPVERAAAYAAQGADELVLLDVSATPEGRSHAADTVAAIRAVLDIPLTTGGGVRTEEDAARLLEAGADKVAVNTAALRDPSLLTRLAERFGRQCVVLSLDAARSENGWRAVVHSGEERTPRDAVDWAQEATELGAGEILLTSWDRDGTREGYDCALVEAVAKGVQVPVIASGGADSADHMAEALGAGADAVLAASILHDKRTTVGQLKEQLGSRGLEVRR